MSPVIPANIEFIFDAQLLSTQVACPRRSLARNLPPDRRLCTQVPQKSMRPAASLIAYATSKYQPCSLLCSSLFAICKAPTLAHYAHPRRPPAGTPKSAVTRRVHIPSHSFPTVAHLSTPYPLVEQRRTDVSPFVMHRSSAYRHASASILVVQRCQISTRAVCVCHGSGGPSFSTAPKRPGTRGQLVAS
jgi:hypothetical protein